MNDETVTGFLFRQIRVAAFQGYSTDGRFDGVAIDFAGHVVPFSVLHGEFSGSKDHGFRRRIFLVLVEHEINFPVGSFDSKQMAFRVIVAQMKPLGSRVLKTKGDRRVRVGVRQSEDRSVLVGREFFSFESTVDDSPLPFRSRPSGRHFSGGEIFFAFAGSHPGRKRQG